MKHRPAKVLAVTAIAVMALAAMPLWAPKSLAKSVDPRVALLKLLPRGS
ncbi:MAG: hypothetical protein HKM03_11775, partial [Steroidobacteraceae bacterium]|nr:hypothetical protein [Steroidobacteraceae bacterium]